MTQQAEALPGVGVAGAVGGPCSQRGSQRGSRRVSRRELFRGGAAMAAFWGAATRRAMASEDPAEVSGDVDPGSLVSKLVRRITMGVSGTELALANSLGYEGYLAHHLDYTAIDDGPLLSLPEFANLDTLTMTPQQLYALPPGVVVGELSQAVILRAVFSARQLFERMVEFWTDHFNIDITNGDDRFLKTVDDREVVREHALGMFPELLSASAHSPAMLFYLDNYASVVGNPNENYARELMELHSLGVGGGYTQQDVEEVARCFTGWGLFQRGAGANVGRFRFNALQHDNGQKTVLGNIIPAGGGIQDGLTVLNILAEHPSTAGFIARKLCRWLLGETVPQTFIDAVASTYTATGGDIKAMARTALSPNVLHDAPPKYKRPFHLFVSAMRALPTSIAATSAIRQQLNAAGHQPFYWTSPDGYPDALDYWSGLILPRWNFGASLLSGGINGASVDVNAFFAGLATAAQMADRVDTAMFGGEMAAPEKERIRAYLLPDPPSLTRKRDAVGLAVGSPGFQWY